MEKNNKKFVTPIVILFVIIVLLGIAFFWTYYSFVNKSYSVYESSLKSYVSKINTLNSSVSSFNTNQTLDINKIKTELPNTIEELLGIKDELSNMNVPSKFAKDHNYILNGINNNINIYRQVLSMIQNSKSNDLQSSIDDLKEYRNSSLHYYSLVNHNKFNINLPTSCMNFISNSIYFANDAIRNNKAQLIIHNQNMEFLEIMEQLSNRFNDLIMKRDYMSYVLKARSENLNYNDIMLLIDEDVELLSKLNNDFSNLNSPSDLEKLHTTFSVLLSEYDIYLQNFKHALLNEKNQALTGNIDAKILNILYAAPKKELSDLKEKYTNFVLLLTEFKNKETSKEI